MPIEFFHTSRLPEKYDFLNFNSYCLDLSQGHKKPIGLREMFGV